MRTLLITTAISLCILSPSANSDAGHNDLGQMYREELKCIRENPGPLADCRNMLRHKGYGNMQERSKQHTPRASDLARAAAQRARYFTQRNMARLRSKN